MKQINAVLALMVLAGGMMCGCVAKQQETTQSIVETTLPQSQASSEQQEIKPSVVEQELPIVSKENKPVQASKVQADPLRYTRVLGTRKSLSNALAEPVRYDAPYLYYEIMSVLMKESTEDTDTMQIGRYNVQTDKNEILGKISMKSMTDSQLLMNEHTIFYLPNRMDANGTMWLDIILFDAGTNTQKTIASYPSGSVFAYAKKLNDTQAVFFFYQQKDSASRDLQQIVIKYDMKADIITPLYEGETMNWTTHSTTKDIWAMDTFDGNIYLLLHQLVEGNMKTFLRTVAMDGTVLEECELTPLRKYNQKENTVDALTVYGDYVFVHYASGNSAAMKKAEGEIVPLNLAGTRFKKLLTQVPVQGKYLLFSMGPPNGKDQNTLFVFDLVQEKGILVKLAVQETSKIVADSDGNLLAFCATEEEESFFAINGTDVLSTIQGET